VLAGLDVREQGGYARAFVPVHRLDGEVIASEALVYMATPENPNWVGDQPLEEIARVIGSAVGPSGPNIEYLVALAASLREMGEDDPHVFALEALVASISQPRG